MANRSRSTYCDVWIDGVSVELPCVISFDWQPAEGDGWHSPRIPESASIERVEVFGVDVTRALPKAFLNQIEAECLSQERMDREEREVDEAQEAMQ